MKKLVFLTFIIIANCTFAQKIGGSAHVYVKNGKGEIRVLNVTYRCVESTEADAKSSLRSKINAAKFYDEEFDSEISYSLSTCDPKVKKKYGGSASVKVKNKKGVTRYLNVTYSCVESTEADAKFSLKSKLDAQKFFDEDYITGIEYLINSCD